LRTGVVFSYKGKNAKQVRIAGDFSSWKRVDMVKGRFGVWYYFLPEYEKKDIVRYKFFVDGIWVEDPMNYDNSDDGNGALVSSTRSAATGENRFVSYRIIKENGKRFVEFRTYNNKAAFISVAGDFNRWNPENDIMTRDERSIWRIRKHLPKGKYRYTFIVDGEWSSDKFNPHNAADPTGKLCSMITIE
jgi:1,4-alpha-glucan branching enzyme